MLSSFILSSFLLALSPGPDNLYLSALTTKSGKLSGISFLLGLLIGCLIHTTLLAFGLNALILEHEIIFELIKCLGIIYLVFLSYEVYKSDYYQDKFVNIGRSNKIFKNLKKGIFMNLLNPKVFLFFALFFPNFLFSDEFSFKTQIFILGTVFILVTFLVFAVIILFSDFIFRKFSQNDNFKIFAKYFNISVLMLIALLILFTENNITLS